MGRVGGLILGLATALLPCTAAFAVYHQPVQLRTAKGEVIPRSSLSFTPSAGGDVTDGPVAIEQDDKDPGLIWLVFPGDAAVPGTLTIAAADRQLVIELPVAVAGETVVVDVESGTAQLTASTGSSAINDEINDDRAVGQSTNDHHASETADGFDITPYLTPLEIGPRAEIGTETLGQKAVKGVVGTALGGFLGGGTRRSSSAAGGPKTKRDPARRAAPLIVNNQEAEITLGLRSIWTDDGLLISCNIEEADERGTFHYIYLLDEAGRLLAPKKFEIFKIWQQHTLTVSWTRSEYVDGALVSRTSGGWSERWTTDLGTFTRHAGGETTAAPGLWQLAGYDRAHAGLRRIGALFELSPEQFAALGRATLVVHITRPRLDPVVTVPFAASLFPAGADSPDLMHFVTPVMIPPEEDP